MKDIPFYPNRADGNSCMVACVKSGLEYLKKRSYSWDEVDDILGYKPHKAAWTVTCWPKLVKQGFVVRMIEPFDYARYEKEGIEYLKSFMTEKELGWQLNHTNLAEIRSQIPGFLKTVEYQQKRPTLEDIDSMLADGFIVFVQLNASALNDKQGYVGHMILVHGKDGDVYIAHDPGPTNAQPNRKIAADKLFDAMGRDKGNIEVTGIKL